MRDLFGTTGITPGPRPSSGPECPSPTVAFVINRLLVRETGRFGHACQTAASARGWAPLFLPTTREDHGAGLARHAVEAGARLVFAVGGDGTVRACASALAGTGVQLAIIPRGTANLAAHALDIPQRLAAALAVGFVGHQTRLDLGVADGMEFIAMAGLGLDAAVVDATRRHRKHRFGWLAYAGASLGHLRGAPISSPSASTAGRCCTGRPDRWWSATPGWCPAVSRCCRTPARTTACSTTGSWRRRGWRTGAGSGTAC